METAVQAVWWVGLLAALGLTAVAVKLLSELLRTLGHLRDLAEWTATAAEGLAHAMAGPLGFEDAARAAEGLRSGAVALQASAARVRSAVDGPRRERPRKETEPGAAGTGAGEIGGAGGGPASGPGGAE